MAAHDPLAQSQGQIFLWSEVSVSKPIDLHTVSVSCWLLAARNLQHQ